MSKGRRRAVRLLIALGAVLSFLAIFSVWLERQVLNTDDWVRTSADLIEDETVRTAVAEFLVDELYANVDMEAELEKILPDDLEGLAGPAAGGLRQGAGQATERILRTTTAQNLWEAANRRAHEELVVVLEGGDERISTEGGVVTLDLGAMLRDLGRQIGLSANLTGQIPAEAARVELLRSDELKTAQRVASGIKGLALLLCLLSLAAFAGAVQLSRGQRWVALLMTSGALIASAFAVLIVRRIAGAVIVERLVEDPGVRPAAESAWAIGTGLLTAIATTVIVFAMLLAVAAWLAAPAPSSRQVRRFLAPGLRDHAAWFYGGLAVVACLYLLIVPDQGLRSLLTVLIVALLAAFGIRELRRTTMSEFPDEPPWTGLDRLRVSTASFFRDVFARGRRAVSSEDREGTGATALGEAVDAVAATPAEAPPPAPTVPPVPVTTDPSGATGTAAANPPLQDDIDRRLAVLERLAALHERGVLTDDELAAEKARLLGPGRDLT